MIRVAFVSLGCDKNLVDTEHMIGGLDPEVFSVVNDESEADAIVVNSCCFIDEAKEESIETILQLAAHKEHGSCRALVVTGCMAERYREELTRELPEVDAILGTGSFSRIGEAIRATLAGEEVSYFDPPELEAPMIRRAGNVLATGGSYAYLKIAEGCDKHCTYCVIPSLRGRYRSIPMELLLEEARDLAENGTKELILIAEETTRYGTDLYGEKRLHVLIREIAKLPGIAWIRLIYCYPEELYPELIACMRDEPKLCHYLDIPIQHADDAILRRMGRRTTRADLVRIIGDLREAIPDIALRTTLISGFPGETDAMHASLLDFVREMRFDRLGVFAYSQEEGTPAAKMPDQIPDEVRQARREVILALQQEIAFARAAERSGTEIRVQIEGFLASDEVYVGRTYADAPDVDGVCFVSSEQPLETGDFIDVVITGSSGYDLIGVVKGDPI